MDWRHHAACRDEDPELFFPVGTSGPALLQIAEAKTVCRRCPVASECLAWALASGQDSGVWGGMSEDERRALKRRNARTGARTGIAGVEPIDLTDPETKQCRRCRVPKPLDQFGCDQATGDGLTSKCKGCRSVESADYRQRVTRRRSRQEA